MANRHNNPTQTLDLTASSIPLLRNEAPYFSNLNRYAEEAFEVANKVNEFFSYTGFVSRLRAASTEPISIYRLVRILDGEVIVSATAYAGKKERFGIVVSEKDSSGYYLVCTFSPNFIFPPSIKQFTDAEIGTYLKVDTVNYNKSICNIVCNADLGDDTILGIVTGNNSVFFCGTTRLFNPNNVLPQTP